MRLKRQHFVTSAVAALVAASGGAALASSHREAPGITETPKIDGTDFYMFRSYEPGREDFVTFIANYQPIQAPYGGPNYFTMDPDAIYEIHIDNDGDAIEDQTYQFNFTTELVNGTGQTLTIDGVELSIPLRALGPIGGENGDDLRSDSETFTITKVNGDRRSGGRTSLTNAADGSEEFAKPIDNIGQKTIPGYGDYAADFIYDVDIPGCPVQGRAFVGQRAEAFAVNLGEIFDLVNLIPIEGDSAPGAGDGGGFPGGVTQDRDNGELVGEVNVTSLALEIPISCVVAPGNTVIGAWTTSSLPQASLQDPSPTYNDTAAFGGAFVQKSRLSAPLVNELIIGLDSKDLFNSAEPQIDGALADFVTNPTLPAILDALFRGPFNATLGTDFDNIAPTNFPRADLVAAFLTGLENVNQISTPPTPAEYLRLNTAVEPTVRADQSTFGVVGDDLAGFPNGRRPGDDAVDIVLRVAMGRLCHPVPVGGADTDLRLCDPEDAPAGLVAFTDGAPISATDLQNAFPYLNNPIPGSPDEVRE